MDQIIVKDLNFSYEPGKNVVKNVSFSIPRGSYTSIIGHNGSGKSTLAKLLVGLLEAQSGDIIINGEKLSQENVYEIRDRCGIVFQNPDNQFIGSTVRDDIAFGLENHQIDPLIMDDIIKYFSEEVHMENFLDHEPTKLSGGQKQRVAIAGVLATHPEIIILDEATSMLDPKGKKDVNDLIDEIHHKHQTTILSITHDIEEVNKSDYVLVMNDGEIVYAGSPDDILTLKQQLVNISLDVPFSVNLALELEKIGLKVSNPLDEERMAEDLWQLYSKI